MKPILCSANFLFARKHFFVFIIFLVGGSVQAATIWYVKPGGTGAPATANSWGTAAAPTNLQAVINAAATAGGGEVWVVGSAGGVLYTPQTLPSGISGAPTARDDAFTLANGVAVYGGFAGTETLRTQRNPAVNITILSGSNTNYHVVLSVGNVNTAILDGFTIESGNANGGSSPNYGGQSINQSAGGGLLCASSSPLINDCKFTNNIAAAGGGACITGTGTAAITNCSFISNTGTATTIGQFAGGGGIQTYGASPNISGCTFTTNNSASEGGGILDYQASTVTVSSCTFTSNTATTSGGGISFESGTSLLVTSSVFTSNSASAAIGSGNTGGGGIYSLNSGLSVSGCTFTTNTATNYGGGILFNSGSNQPISSSVFSKNTANYGAGMALLNGSAPDVSNCNISKGTASVGGGIYVNSGSGTFISDSLLNNKATVASGMAGGGMCTDNGANTKIYHCWFQGNVASGGDGAGQYNNGTSPTDSACVFEANLAQGASSNGGGVVNNGGNAKDYNCVLVDNAATADGGAVYSTGTSAGTIESCTLYNNSAASGGGIYEVNNSAKYYSNIIWNSTPNGFVLAGAVGSLKLRYNDFPEAASFSGGSVSNNISTAPSFGNAGVYQGADGIWATADDGLHLTGSLAADAIPPSGANTPGILPTDITEFLRVDAGSGATATYADIGAYEGTGTFTPLSIQFLNFTASAPSSSNAVDLHWQVDAGQKARAYMVQRSLNGTDFSGIGTVNAVPGQTNYSYTDQNAAGDAIYYRLQVEQADGTQQLSSMVMVRSAAMNGNLSLRPSVSQQGFTTLYIWSLQNTDIGLIIADASGLVLLRRTITIGQGDNYIPLDISGFHKGIYYLHVSGGNAFGKTLPLEKL